MPLVRCGLLLLFVCLMSACGRTSAAPRKVEYDADGRSIGSAPLPREKTNLIVLVVDSLRHDSLAQEGTPGAPTPFLASLAARGVAFVDASSAAPWTLPSVTSLLTGVLPSRHGMNTMESRVRLSASVTTFAELLRNAYGYETAAFFDGNWFANDGSTVLQGFDHVRRGFTLQNVQASVQEWNRIRDPSRPFFLLLHTNDVHDPYGAANHPFPPRDHTRGRPGLSLGEMEDPKVVTRVTFLDRQGAAGLQRALGLRKHFDILFRYIGTDYAADPDLSLSLDLETAYWDGVRWMDGLLGRAHEHLVRSRLLKDTLLVVTADHGEAFGEHGFLGHGRNLFDETIRVPLVMVGPPPFRGGRTLKGSVSLLDVLPTFLDHVGVAPVPGGDGRSLLPLVRGEELACRPSISEERLLYGNMRREANVVLLSARTPT